MSESGNIRFSEWVDDAKNPLMKEFRQAVHTICAAISEMNDLGQETLLKGGILLALKYRSTRYTKDVDFSTNKRYDDFDDKVFKKSLQDALDNASEQLSYGLICKIQKYKVEPSGEGRNFQSMDISIGYAKMGSKNFARLKNKRCTNVVRLDYSFNEIYREVDFLEIDENKSIKAYCLAEQVAEKYRAIIQQKFRPHTNRRQDIYDISYLLESGYLSEGVSKEKILKSLVEKSESRGITVDRFLLEDSEIRKKSRINYSNLKGEIKGDLPDFDLSYKNINDFYKSLPWETVGKE